MSDAITVQDIPHPLPEGREIADFITPDWHELIRFYPQFCQKVVEAGGEPYEPQPWALTVCRELVRLGAREGRTVEEWMQRAVEHFGLQWLTDRFEEMGAARRDAMEGGSMADFKDKVVQEKHEIYDLLSEALGPHENEAHGAPVPGIRTLMHQRDDALRLVKRFRWRAQEEIDGGDVKADVRFNGGNPVLLCHLCNVIMAYGVDPRTVKAAICPEGHGCGANMDKVREPMDRFLAPTGSDE